MRTYGLRFDVNCSILFTELPLLARPAAAKAAGFGAVEFWWPWDEMVPTDRQADAFVAALADAGVQLVSLNFHTGDMAAGERGLVSIPSATAAFRENIAACAEIAGRTGCGLLNAPYGNRQDGVDPAEQDAVAIENLTLAAAAAAKAGARVLVEAINSIDVPAFPIDSSAAAIAVIDKVPAANVAFLADMYHLAMMGEDLAHTLSAYAGRLAHVQLADVPGRGAPGTGTPTASRPGLRPSWRGGTGPRGTRHSPRAPCR